MNDANKMLRLLSDQNLSLYVEKKGKVIYKSTERRLKPLYLCLQAHAKDMNGALLVDKLVGAAAAYLSIMGQVKRVITPVASQAAVVELKKAGIPLYAKTVIPHVMNQDKSGLCPMEKLALQFNSAQDFYQHIAEHIFQ